MIEISRNNFISLIKYVVDNLDDKDYQTTVDKRMYGLKKCRKIFAGNNYQKNSKNEARELYDSLIKPDTDTLKNTLTRGKNKRNNILAIIDNIKSSLFEGSYVHHKRKLLETEESIEERAKLRRQRSYEIAKKERNIDSKVFERYFESK